MRFSQPSQSIEESVVMPERKKKKEEPSKSRSLYKIVFMNDKG